MKVRLATTLLFLLITASLASTTAWAQNPHYVSGPIATLSNNDTVLTACATIAGLGNIVTDVSVTCRNVSFQCINKADNINNANETLTATKEFTPHNGTIKDACVSLTPSCPPGQVGPVNVTFSGCTYTVQQNGQDVLGPTDLVIPQ